MGISCLTHKSQCIIIIPLIITDKLVKVCHSKGYILLMFILLSLHEKTRRISTTPEWDASPMQGYPPGSTNCKKIITEKQY